MHEISITGFASLKKNSIFFSSLFAFTSVFSSLIFKKLVCVLDITDKIRSSEKQFFAYKYLYYAFFELLTKYLPPKTVY